MTAGVRFGDQLRSWGDMAIDELVAFADRSVRRERPVLRLPPVDELVERAGARAWIARGGMDVDHARAFLSTSLDGATALHHPGFLGQQVAVPHAPSAVADLVHGATNNGMAIYEMGPTAVALERAVIDWMLEKVGWPPLGSHGVPDEGPRGGGVLTHGGSLANLTAILAARAATAPEAWSAGTPGDLAVLVPESTHYSIARAVSIAGIGADNVVPLPVDEREVVRADMLPAVVRRVEEQGRRIVAVVANGCSTPNGMYDPIGEMAAICREHGLWLHVDGAHGASALVSLRDRALLEGIEHADSLSWDAHKMMGASTLVAAALFRDGRRLKDTFRQTETYLTQREDAGPGPDLIALAVECTKAPLALKLFLNLASIGESGMAAHVEGLHDAALELARKIEARPALELPFQPMSNIVCFAFGADDGATDRKSGSTDARDRLQLEIRARIVESGAFYIGSVVIAGRRWLRVVVMNPATTDADFDAMLDAVECFGGRPSDQAM